MLAYMHEYMPDWVARVYEEWLKFELIMSNNESLKL